MNYLLQNGYVHGPFRKGAVVVRNGKPEFAFNDPPYNDWSVTPEGNKYLTWVNANVVVPFGFYDPAEGH